MEGERAERIHAIVYSCDSREELAQRIVALEDEAEKQKIKLEVLKAHGIEIVDDGCCKTGECYYERCMRELGIEEEVAE